MDQLKVAIIGTAGRKEDGPKLSKELYIKMCKRAEEIIVDLCRREIINVFDVRLISGGAAWADHVAISLFLKWNGRLTLYLPADYDEGKFISEKPRDTGSIANYYHSLFSKKMGGNTVGSIQKVIELGADVIVNARGFKARNTQVAEDADVVIALTFGEGDAPKDGGTFDTWIKAEGKERIHIPLGEL